ERHLESVLDFLARERELEARLHERHHRCDAKAGDDDVIRKIAEDSTAALMESDLRSRFAQRGRRGAAVARLDTTAGEADLPGVVAQLRGGLRGEDGEVRPLGEGD